MADYLHPLWLRLLSLVVRAFRRLRHSSLVAAVRVPPLPATIPKQATQPCVVHTSSRWESRPRPGDPFAWGARRNHHPRLPRMGLPAVRLSNVEIMFAAKTPRCYFASFKVSIGLGRLAVFVSTQKRESTRSHSSDMFFLTTVCAGARLPSEGLAARCFDFERISAGRCDSHCRIGS